MLILAALLHDIGHWPFCHPIEDISIKGLPTHENFATEYITRESIASCLKEDWDVTPEEVIDVINRKKDTPAQAVVSSILSGPIDIDKMDYLYRDSLHAGVPYGQNFDALRLIRSLCLNEAGDRLAITQKGRTAAELMVFARYVMFSEVYWHHAVRSATAMFQRAFYLWHQTKLAQSSNQSEFSNATAIMFELSETEMLMQMKADVVGTQAEGLFDDLFGKKRNLYKRVANYSFAENEPLYRAIAQKPYQWLVLASERLCELVGQKLGREISPLSILIDAPPVGLEVQFNVDVFYSNTNSYRKLGDVSPVVNTLARRQFDDFVKQVRIFVKPELKADVLNLDLNTLVGELVKMNWES